MTEIANESSQQRLVTLGLEGAIATITLDSPDNRNALSRRLVSELLECLDEVAANDEVRAVCLRAEGRVFCSGADLSEASTGSMEQGAAAMVEMQRQILALPQPVVAAVQGPVRAGGLGLVAAADVAVVAREVSFALTEVKLGLAPAVISLSLLPRLAPRAASELFLTGRTFGADVAAEIGLVTRAVPADELNQAVRVVLDELADGSAQGLRETKRLLNADLLTRLDRLADETAQLSARLFDSEEARAAMVAFIERKNRG